MSKLASNLYRTLNWSAYDASLRERGSLTVWFDPAMVRRAAPSGKRGRRQTFSGAAIQACPTIKVLFRLPLRQTTGFVASLLELVGLDWPVPDYSTLCRRQRTLAVQLPYRGSAGPLHLLVPSRALLRNTLPGEGQHRHQGALRRGMACLQAWRGAQACPLTGRVSRSGVPRGWRKVHLAVDEATLEVRAVEITGSHVGDAPMLPDLLGQIPKGASIRSVTADGAYDTRGCRDAIAGHGAHAIIRPRRNAKPWKRNSPGAPGRDEALRAVKRLGRTIWRRWSGYHRQSRIETNPLVHCCAIPCRAMDELREAPWPKADVP